MNPIDQLLNLLAANQFRADHPVPDHWNDSCPRLARDVGKLVAKYADKVEQGYCPIKADRELKDEFIALAQGGGRCNDTSDLSVVA